MSEVDKAFYRTHGWVVLHDVIPRDECARIRDIASDMVEGRIDCRKNRMDLGGFTARQVAATENITQIGWPSDLTSLLDENLLMIRGRAISDALYSDAPGTWALDM